MPIPGRFVWYELLTDAPEAAQEFYAKVLGWQAEASEAVPGYTRMLNPATPGAPPVAGVMALPEAARAAGAPPHWGAYIGVAALEETIRAAEALGATICVPATEIPGIGRFAALRDPDGANFAVFEPAEMPDPPPVLLGMGHPGHFAWHELRSPAGGRALDFYGTLFGWQAGEAVEIGEAGAYQMFAAGDTILGGMMRPPLAGMPPHWLYYAQVDNIDAAAARIAAAGGTLLMEPHEVPGGAWIVQALDPQGAAFALVGQRKAG